MCDPRRPARAGAVVDDVLCTEDLYPTLLGLAGLRDKPTPGLDVSPVARGEATSLDRDGVLLEYTHDLRANCAFYSVQFRGLRTKRWKYTVLGSADGGTPWQLFDLDNDPHELHNLVNDPASQSEAARLHRLLRDKLVETVDHYVLAPAFGCEGLNQWKQA